MTRKNLLKKYILLIFLFSNLYANAQQTSIHSETDKKVRAFLNSYTGRRYFNVPKEDGQLLYDLIIKNNYRHALEIGTSTGISTIWMAWALSKTGGKLITIEIDETRYRQALKNIEAAGLSEFVDARLGDAHELVPELEGPFDFVFSDADKGWYKNYFLAVSPKLLPGGCYTSHNVSGPAGYLREYYHFLQQQPGYKTTVDNRGAGMAISYKKKK